jgi:hypothetical protein
VNKLGHDMKPHPEVINDLKDIVKKINWKDLPSQKLPFT